MISTTAREAAGIYTVSNEHVGIAAVALNQRRSLNQRFVAAGRMAVSDVDLKQSRSVVPEVETRRSLAILLDCEFLPCLRTRNSNEVALAVL
jgi:tagatose-1,6-bisphosphate aldolase